MSYGGESSAVDTIKADCTTSIKKAVGAERSIIVQRYNHRTLPPIYPVGSEIREEVMYVNYVGFELP
jgi:hypothetical protein